MLGVCGLNVVSPLTGFVKNRVYTGSATLNHPGPVAGRNPPVTIRAYRRWPLVDPSAARSSRRACIADLRGGISSRIVLQMIALLIPK